MERSRTPITMVLTCEKERRRGPYLEESLGCWMKRPKRILLTGGSNWQRDIQAPRSIESSPPRADGMTECCATAVGADIKLPNGWTCVEVELTVGSASCSETWMLFGCDGNVAQLHRTLLLPVLPSPPSSSRPLLTLSDQSRSEVL